MIDQDLELRLTVIEQRLNRTVTKAEFYRGLLILAGTMTGIIAVLLALFQFGLNL